MKFESPEATYDSYMKTLGQRKGVVEEGSWEKSSEARACSFASRRLSKVETVINADQFWARRPAKLYGCVFPGPTQL